MEQTSSKDASKILPGALLDQNLSVDRVHLSCSGLEMLATIASAHIMMTITHILDPYMPQESLCKATDVCSRAITVDLDDRTICEAHGWAGCHSEKSNAAR